MRLEITGAEKWYLRGTSASNRFYAVRDAQLSLEEGSLTVLTGRSGSGKTTLMHMMAGLLTPSTGTVRWGGEDLYAKGDEELSRLRNRHSGFISQGNGAVSGLTVMENVLLPWSMYSGKSGKTDASRAGATGLAETVNRAGITNEAVREKAVSLLERFGIGELADVSSRELSGGELRRMAIARALAGSPDLVFADEPTSDLDDENMRIVLEALRKAADEGAAVFVVTHDREALEYADQSYAMKDGCLIKV